MAELWFQVVTRTAADREALTSHMRAHVFHEEIVGHEKMLEADPRNTALHNGVALLHAAVGNLTGAAEPLPKRCERIPTRPRRTTTWGWRCFFRDDMATLAATSSRRCRSIPTTRKAMTASARCGNVRERQVRHCSTSAKPCDWHPVTWTHDGTSLNLERELAAKGERGAIGPDVYHLCLPRSASGSRRDSTTALR